MSARERCTIWAFHPAGSTPALWEPVRRADPELVWDTPDLNAISSALPASASYRQLIDELLDLAPSGPLVIVGAGFGARIGLSLAARLEERVRATYLVTPTPVVEDEAFLAKLAGLRRLLVDGFSEAQVVTLVPVMLFRWGPRYAAASRELEAILRAGLGDKGAAYGRICLVLDEQPANWLHLVRGPIEVIFGSTDPIFEAKDAEGWRQQGIRSVEVLPGVSNQPPLEIPDRVAADLRRLTGAG